MREVLGDLRHMYVLLVEDDAETLDLTATLLRTCGATVKAPSEARQALKVVRYVRSTPSSQTLLCPTKMATGSLTSLMCVPRGEEGGAELRPVSLRPD